MRAVRAGRPSGAGRRGLSAIVEPPGRLAALRGRAGRRPLLAYLVIGGLSYVVDAGLLLALSAGPGVPLWAAASAGYWTSVLVNFGLNRLVFHVAGGGPVHRHALRYGALLALNYVVTLVVLEVGTGLGVPVLAAKTFAVALTTCWNFVLYRVWVFR